MNLLRAGASPQLVKTHLGHKDTNLVWRVYGNYITDDRDYALMDSEAELLVERSAYRAIQQRSSRNRPERARLLARYTTRYISSLAVAHSLEARRASVFQSSSYGMTRVGFEPTTYGLKVRCSTS